MAIHSVEIWRINEEQLRAKHCKFAIAILRLERPLLVQPREGFKNRKIWEAGPELVAQAFTGISRCLKHILLLKPPGVSFL